jgi:hypothetical protein
VRNLFVRISIKQLGAAALAVVLGAGAVASLGQPDHASAAADGSTVVINEVYGGGGNSGAPFNRDFVELYNPTDAAIDLGGYQVVRYSGSGNPQGDTVTIPAGTTLEPGATLVVGGAYGANASAADVPVDVEGEFALGASNGAVDLTDASGAIVDLVGFGTVGGNAFETAAAPGLSNSTSAQRMPDGADTDDNSADFVAADPTPGALNDSDETPEPTDPVEPTDPTEPTDPAECDVAISEIQGTGTATPLPTDQAVTTCGVVAASTASTCRPRRRMLRASRSSRPPTPRTASSSTRTARRPSRSATRCRSRVLRTSTTASRSSCSRASPRSTRSAPLSRSSSPRGRPPKTSASSTRACSSRRRAPTR